LPVTVKKMMFPIKGNNNPNVIIQGSKSHTPRRKPMNAPALFNLFSQFRTLLKT